MRAGRLRHVLTVQVNVPVQDSSGDPAPDWQTIGTVRGAIEPIRGREATFGNQTLAEMDTRIIVRYSQLSAQITAAHRLVHQGTPFNIVSIAQKDLAQRELEILAKSGVNDG